MYPRHALPLIPPVDVTMSYDKCRAEISRLRSEHCAEIGAFAAGIKSGSLIPGAQWNASQHDLWRVLNPVAASSIDGPTSEHLGIWSHIGEQLDEEVARRLSRDNLGTGKLVACITQEDCTVVAHRFEGPHVHNTSEDACEVDDDEGPGWFYQTSFFEPGEFSRGSQYIVPSLYLLGTLDPQSGEWRRATATDSELYRIKDTIRAMEALADGSRLETESGIYGTPLPMFPSDAHLRLAEIEPLGDWLGQAGIASKEEHQHVEGSISEMKNVEAFLSGEVQALTDKLDVARAAVHRLRAESFLEFHGFAVGQSVTHKDSGVTGVIAVDKSNWASLVIKSGAEEKQAGSPTRQGVGSNLMAEIRRKEWVSAAPADGQADEGEADPVPASRPSQR